jgi:hypothetical protein
MDFKDHVPFEPKKTEEERTEEKSWVISIRINDEENALIQKAKQILDIESDTKALKIMARVGLNVIQNTFSEETMRYLSSSKRERKTDYEKGFKKKINVL